MCVCVCVCGCVWVLTEERQLNTKIVNDKAGRQIDDAAPINKQQRDGDRALKSYDKTKHNQRYITAHRQKFGQQRYEECEAEKIRTNDYTKVRNRLRANYDFQNINRKCLEKSAFLTFHRLIFENTPTS